MNFNPLSTNLYFPKTIDLCEAARKTIIYLDSCKLIELIDLLSSTGTKWCLVSPCYGVGYYGSFSPLGEFYPSMKCKKEFITILQEIEDKGCLPIQPAAKV